MTKRKIRCEWVMAKFIIVFCVSSGSAHTINVKASMHPLVAELKQIEARLLDMELMDFSLEGRRAVE